MYESFKYIIYVDDSTLSTCIADDNAMDSAELIKININADKTKYMLFSYNVNVNFPFVKIGNNKINEISVSKFVGIHLDKKLNFVNHITEMLIKVVKSIGPI